MLFVISWPTPPKITETFVGHKYKSIVGVFAHKTIVSDLRNIMFLSLDLVPRGHGFKNIGCHCTTTCIAWSTCGTSQIYM